MKRTFVILVLIVCACQLNAQSWEWQNPLPQGNDLYDAVWLTQTEVLAVGGCGTVLRSTDSGSSWNISHLTSTQTLRAISRVDELTLWAAGNQGTIFRSTDGGMSWEAKHDSIGGWFFEINALQFTSENTGWVGGLRDVWEGLLWHTTDGGDSWTEQVLPAGMEVTGLDFVNDSTGWSVGSELILHTTDGGENWVEQVWYDTTGEPIYAEFGGVDFVNEQEGWAVGAVLLHTTNGGQQWQQVDMGEQFSALDLEFLTPEIGMLIGWDVVYLTSDGGVNWSVIDPPTASDLRGFKGIAIRDVETSLLVGDAGRVLRSQNGGQTWQLLTGAMVSDLSDVAFVDTLTGWAVGNSYSDVRILHTEDGGLTWVPQAVDFLNELDGIFFLDRFRGWAVGHSALCRTTDGGQTWFRNSEFTVTFRAVHFVDSLRGWAVGNGQTLVRTVDGGLSWTLLHEGPDTQYTDVYFSDSLTGWIVGCEGLILHTTDGGLIWAEQYHDSHTCLQQLSFADSWTGWAVGTRFADGGVIVKTTDGGQHWIEDERDYPWLRGVEFFNHQIGWVICPTHKLYRTLDGGLTWTIYPTGTNNWISAVSFGAVNRVWAVGENGTILRFADSITAADEPPSRLMPLSYTLSAYPNPFNSSTRLSYDIPVTGQVQITVFDLTGRLVRTLEDRVMARGLYTLHFDGADLPSGMYFVRLKAAQVSKTEKVLLLK